ncbi:MAG: DUF1592 domain-containing protein [Planctomycetota bacterium]
MSPARPLSALALLAAIAPASHAEPATDPHLDVKQVLEDRCVVCHSVDYSEGELELDSAIQSDQSAAFWRGVLERVERSEMPPADAEPLSAEERETLVAALQSWRDEALRREPPPPLPVIRRLTKTQYAATLRRLLDVPEILAADLPEDAKSKLGFTGAVSAEETSALHIEYYQAIARRALERALPTGPKPAAAHYRVTLGDEIKPESRAAEIKGYKGQSLSSKHIRVEVLGTHDGAGDQAGIEKHIGFCLRGSDRRRYSVQDDGVLLQPGKPHREVSPYAWWGPSPNLKMLVRRHYPIEGPFVLRVRARPADLEAADGETPVLRAIIGSRTDDGMQYVTVGDAQDVTPGPDEGGWRTYEFRGDLEAASLDKVNLADKNPLANILVVGVWNEHLAPKGESTPALVVQSMELELRAYEQWPPASARRLMPESKLRESQEPSDWLAYTRDVIERFAGRAFRRPATDAEVDRYAALWQAIRPQCESYEQSVRETLVAVLCSPAVLYTGAQVRGLADAEHGEYTLASRLAYFLWNEPPDDELLSLAADGRLRAELSTQVERMAADPRAWGFVRSFVGQWLRLDRHDAMQVSVRKHPDYNRYVKAAMAEETYQFFHHLLTSNRPVDELVSADYSLLNETLARFYGVPGVQGNAFRPVDVTGQRPVGGLLGQGAILVGHSDGAQAHTIKRAVWLRSRVLGDPPPEPPPNVPELPEATGDLKKLSLAERLALHRDKASCRSCHAGIDPYGLPLEQFDAVGRPIKAETAATLPGGASVRDAAELRNYLLDQRRQDLARSLAMHLYAYATGIDPGVHDDAAIDAIAARGAEGGTLELVKAVAESDALLGLPKLSEPPQPKVSQRAGREANLAAQH